MAKTIGHRGACGHEQENTIASFVKAVELGADMIEFDVRLTKDLVPVVLHDRSIYRVSGRRGLIAKLTFDECRENPLKGGGKIPSLEEACKLVLESNIEAYIEVKVPDRKGIIIGKVLEHLPVNRFYIASFDKAYLTLIETNYPEIRTIVITNRNDIRLIDLITKNHADCFSVEYHSIDSSAVEAAHNTGRKLFAWTVNEPSDIERLKALGVDGIVSDYPERVG